MATPKEYLVDWLRDAHAMEERAEKMLTTTTASRLQNYPDLKARLEQHAADSRQQADRVSGCLERLGASESSVKNLAGKVAAMAQGLSGMFVSDEVVKAMMATHTFEHMEITAPGATAKH